MKGKKEDPNAQPRRGSQPKAPTGLNDETAVETHDLIHRAEEEEQKMHGSHALTQPDSGPGEGKAGLGGQQHQSTMDKVKKALHMENK